MALALALAFPLSPPRAVVCLPVSFFLLTRLRQDWSLSSNKFLERETRVELETRILSQAPIYVSVCRPGTRPNISESHSEIKYSSTLLYCGRRCTQAAGSTRGRHCAEST